MHRVFLNTDAIKVRLGTTARSAEVWPTAELGPIAVMTRRRFLQSMGAATALLSYSQARALQAWHVDASGKTATLRFDGATIWSIDTSWLAGHPHLTALEREDAIEIALSGARYPGTHLSADFRARIVAGIGAPVMQIEHSLADNHAEVVLADWLNGTAPLTFIGRAAPFSAAVGQSLRVRQIASAQVSISPALALHAVNANGWVVEGTEFSGTADGFKVTRAASLKLIDTDIPLKRAHVVVTPANGGVRMSPLLSGSGEHSYHVGGSPLTYLQIEAAEAADGARHHAFLSEGTGVAIVSERPAPEVNSQSARVLARNPQYARTVASDGESHAMWAAVQGQGMMGFGQHMLVTAPLTPGHQLKIEEKAGGCMIDCCAYPQTLALASDADVSITLRFPPAAANAVDAASNPPSICPFTFRHQELPLDGAEITFKRPANALLLRFRFNGFKLVRTWRGVRLVVRDRARCRLHLVVGAQAIVERAYFEPPTDVIEPTPQQIKDRDKRYKDWLRIQYDRTKAPASDRDAFVDRAFNLYKGTDDPKNAEWQAAGVFPSKARISRESQLVYRLKAGADEAKIEKLELDVRRLLDDELWDLVVVQDAASTETVRGAAGSGFPKQADKSIPPADATCLEMPSSLYISPNQDAKFKTEGLDTGSTSRFQDIFRIAGVTTRGAEGMPLRAIAARGFTKGEPPAHFNPTTPADPDPIAMRTPTDMRDRIEFVWLSSQWNNSALPGTHDVRERGPNDSPSDKLGYDGIYVPQPFYASKLLLSSMGGSLKSLGRWDPPALTKFALSVERWEHSSTFARSDQDVVVYKGFLLPLGIRASLVKVTRRQERRLNDMGVTSMSIQKFFIEVSNPMIEYTGALAPSGGRTWPFNRLELLLRGRLQIDDPSETGYCGFGQSAFRICVGKEGYPFGFEIEGDAKRRGAARMAFIDNTIAHNSDALKCVTAAFNSIKPEDWPSINPPSSSYYIEIKNSKIQYAPSKKSDDTSYVTGKMFVRLFLNEALVNSAIIEASGKPPTFPEMETASIVIPALNRLTGRSDDTVTDVRFAPLYTAVGFNTDPTVTTVNSSEVFLELKTPVTASFSGKGERAGAVGAPNMDAVNLSRYLGLMGKTAQPLTPPAGQLSVSRRSIEGTSTSSKVNFNAGELFRPDAKVLGVLRMSDLFEAINLDEVPKFIESARHQIDAASDEVNSKICSFVNEGACTAAELLTRIGGEIKYEPVRTLKQDLEAFSQALRAISNGDCGTGNCAPGTFELGKAIEQIGLAGQALDKARRTVDSILQNPSMLLPEPVRKLVDTWTSLVAQMLTSYEKLKSLAIAGQGFLTTYIQETARAATDNANALVAAELNAAYSQLSHFIEQIIAASLPADRQIEQFLEFYGKYAAIYTGVVGWYREVDSHKAEYRLYLTEVANQVILKASTEATSYAHLVTSKIADPLRELDAALRNWTEEAQEEARAFFRRFEPSAMRLSEALLALLNLSQARVNALPQHINDIRKSLDELEQAVIAETRIQPPIHVAYRKYLEDPTEGIKRKVQDTRAKLADAAMQMQNMPVSIAGSPARPVVVVLNDLESRLAANGAIVLLPVVKDVKKAWQAGTSADMENLLSTTNALAQLCVIASPGFESVAPAISKLDDSILTMVKGIHAVLTEWMEAIAPQDNSEPAWWEVIKDYGYLFAPAFAAQANLNSLRDALRNSRDALINGKTYLGQPASAAFQDIPKAIAEVQDNWSKIATQLKALGETPDRVAMDFVRRSIAGLMERLVPAEVHLDFSLDTEIKKDVGSVFRKGDGKENENTHLKLSASIVQNLISGASSAEFRGTLQHFRLDLLGFLIITFEDVTFEALAGSAPKLLPPNITDVQFKGCLSFVEALQNYFRRGSGPYVLPLPGGIKAGYALRPGVIPVPPMIIQNLVIDAGIEIPYDDRAATTTFAVSSRRSPALLFIAPYGGTMFFGLTMAGDRLVNVEASFEAGLVAAFDLGAVVGTGRVTLGFYFRQSGSKMLLDGFFFAGGEGTVLAIVSISVSLRIGIAYEGDAVKGYGEFSVEMGCSPFTWTLDYRVDRSVGKLTNARTVEGIVTGRQPHDGAVQSPVTNLETDAFVNLFLDPQTWREFQSAFARI